MHMSILITQYIAQTAQPTHKISLLVLLTCSYRFRALSSSWAAFASSSSRFYFSSSVSTASSLLSVKKTPSSSFFDS